MIKIQKDLNIYSRSDSPCHVAVVPPQAEYSQRTVLVMGNGRGGTSAIAGLIHMLGIPLVGLDGKPHKLRGGNVEDLQFAKLSVELRKPAGHVPATRKLIKLIESRNRKYDNWGWKDPESLYYLESIVPHLRNPLIVFVVRNFFEVAWSNKSAAEAIGQMVSIEQCMNWVMEKYSKIWNVLLRIGCPVLLVSYERGVQNSEVLAQEVCHFLRHTPSDEQLRNALAWINPNGGYNRGGFKQRKRPQLELRREQFSLETAAPGGELSNDLTPPRRDIVRGMDRKAFMTQSLQKEGKLGLEIAPYFNPVLPKSEGWNTTVVDYYSTEELVNAAQTHSSQTMQDASSKIEEVDIVWKTGPLDEVLLAKHESGFDFVVASHVVEHIPNLLGFLWSLENALKDGGHACFAVPDLRFTFDFFQSPSTLGQLLKAEKLGLDRHPPEQIFDVLSRNAFKHGDGAWLTTDRNGPVEIRKNLESAWATYESLQKSTHYVDCHSWYFTPASFELLMLELRHLGLTRFVLTRIASAEEGVQGSEFLVELVKSEPCGAATAARLSEKVHARRQELLRKIVSELAERIQQFPTDSAAQ